MVHDLDYRRLRRAAYQFANEILTLTPEGEERQEALRKVREALAAAKGAFPIEVIPPLCNGDVAEE